MARQRIKTIIAKDGKTVLPVQVKVGRDIIGFGYNLRVAKVASAAGLEKQSKKQYCNSRRLDFQHAAIA